MVCQFKKVGPQEKSLRNTDLKLAGQWALRSRSGETPVYRAAQLIQINSLYGQCNIKITETEPNHIFWKRKNVRENIMRYCRAA